MYTIRKQFKFEMSHQLVEAYSCACSDAIHGHSYVMELFLTSDKLDHTGMVMDFGEVKALINDYVDSWDHCLVMSSEFPKEYLEMLGKYNKKMKVVTYNPTAEAMANDMYYYIKDIIPQVSKVRLHETVTGWAEYYE